MKKWIAILLGPLVSVGIIFALVGADLDAVGGQLERANYVYLLPTAVLLLMSLLMRAIRWHVLLNQRVNLWHSFHIINIGYFLSAILPLRLGDFARAYLTTRLENPMPAFATMSTIVIERLLDVLALVGMMGLMLILLDVPSAVTKAGFVVGGAALLGGIVLAVLAARPVIAFWVLERVLKLFPMLKRFSLEERLQHFIDGIKPMGTPRVAVGALLWSGVAWAFSLLAGYVLLFFLFEEPTFAATVSLIVLATLSVALPAVPGNLGPFEGAVVGGLWIGGMISSASPPDNAPAVATGVVLHALTLGLYALLGIIGLSVEQASVRQVTSGARDVVMEQHTADHHPREQQSVTPESVTSS
jgi:glycosyltransferase 2 family protein